MTEAAPTRPRRWWLWLVLGAILAISGGTVVFVRSPRVQKLLHPPVLIIPADEEVIEIRASLCKSEGVFAAEEPVPEFTIPTEDVSPILALLRPAEYVPEPPHQSWDELGEVVIRTRDGRELRLRFFWAGYNPIVVTPDGVDYFRGSAIDGRGMAIDGGIRLGNIIRKAFKASKHGSSKP